MSKINSLTLIKIKLVFLLVVLAGCLPSNRGNPTLIFPTSNETTEVLGTNPVPSTSAAPKTETLPPIQMRSGISGRIVYSSIVHRNPLVTQIFLKNLDTGKVIQLTNSGNNSEPIWSPDCSQIMFVSWTAENSYDIYVMDSDGNHQQPLVSSSANEHAADWSPDGNKVAFVSDKDGISEIYVVDLNTQSVIRLTNNTVIDFSPKWSTDGTRIAFISGSDGLNSHLFTMRFDGTDIKQITSGNYTDESPAWCPDDSCLIFKRSSKLMLLDLKSNDVYALLDGFSEPGLQESDIARSPKKDLFTFSIGGVFYAMELKSRELYQLLDEQVFDLSLCP